MKKKNEIKRGTTGQSVWGKGMVASARHLAESE